MDRKQILQRIEELKQFAQTQGLDISAEIAQLEKKLEAEAPAKGKGTNSAIWHKVQASRHQNRPKPQHFIEALVHDFVELHGDRTYGDDHAIIGGIGRFEGQVVTVIGTRKGQNLQSNMEFNFGMPHPEGYRKALRLMKQAEKFGRPVLLFVDTPGAYPGIQSEERGMAEAIARNLYEMAGLRVPLLTTITGEGGSGGALALAVSDRIYMLENAIFSVISPEGCASILFKDATQAPKAAESLKLDAEGISALGLVDAVIREPDEITLDPTSTFEALRVRLAADLAELKKLSVEELLALRYRKFRTMGQVEREPEEEQIAEEKALHAVYNR